MTAQLEMNSWRAALRKRHDAPGSARQHECVPVVGRFPRLGVNTYTMSTLHKGVKRMRRDVPRLAFNQQEAAESLGVSVDHFERHVKDQLPIVYCGSRKLYPLTGLQRWLAENEIHRGRRVA